MVIKKAEYITSGVSEDHFPKLDYPQFVFMGRSNVGKSSFINALTNRKNLAHTSGKPGKTQTLNFFNINDRIIFVDIPGYGYAQRSMSERQKFGEMIEHYLLKSQNLRLCFLIIDLRIGPTSDDLLMYNYLKHYQKKIVIIATKADKIGTTKILSHIKIVKQKFNNPEDQIIAVSSQTHKGLDEVWRIIEDYLNSKEIQCEN